MPSQLRSLATLAVAVTSLAFTVSCAKKNPHDSDSNFGYDDGFGDSYGGAAGGDYSNFSSGNLPSRDERYSYFNSSTGQFEPVYFAFDSFSIGSGEMSKIDAVASYLKRNGKEVLVAGFTDAVGTEEYNRGLGDRRAQAVQQALRQRGVTTRSIQTVSFGEEMLAEPSNPTSGRNRRVEFGIVR